MYKWIYAYSLPCILFCFHVTWVITSYSKCSMRLLHVLLYLSQFNMLIYFNNSWLSRMQTAFRSFCGQVLNLLMLLILISWFRLFCDGHAFMIVSRQLSAITEVALLILCKILIFFVTNSHKIGYCNSESNILDTKHL